MVLERFSTSEETYGQKLGAALKLERTVLELLEVNIRNAASADVKELLGSHLEQSRANLQAFESVFGLLGLEVDESPCPVADAFEKEDKTKIRKAQPPVVDTIVLQGVLEIEHYVIGVYENLTIRAGAMNRQDVVEVLQRNLCAKQTALAKVKDLLALAVPVR
jgi:ferritin-like metal-binding protein YciE